MKTNKILIVEDDEIIANLLYMSLNNAGYICDVVYSGKTAADKLEECNYDIGIFDIMIPEIDGYELLGYAETMDLPVIFLTAKSSTGDKVQGLKSGADDYITKPFEITELLARVENVLRRYQKTVTVFKLKDLEIDTNSWEIRKNGTVIDVTLKEFELLLLFLRNPNIALYRKVIYERVWDCEYTGNSRTVDLHVQRLRKKLGLENEIISVYKIGYRLVVK